MPMTHVAFIGIGANLGDRLATIASALRELSDLGAIRRTSTLYRTKPWGRTDQPDFYNAVAEISTEMPPRELLAALQRIERRLGRTAGERWGPRVIDFDILIYDDLEIASDDLRIPHPLLRERAFALVPLAELDERFAPWRDALDAQRAGVEPLSDAERARFATLLGESDMAMPEEPNGIAQRVRALAEFLRNADAARVRIQRGNEVIEVVRGDSGIDGRNGSAHGHEEPPPARIDTIRADVVGIFHFGRPPAAVGDVFDDDRELGHIEALGIRTGVHTLGPGRLLAVAAGDAAPVEYGQALFMIARG
jgi:2-amino-4-hydroxy-6-hydroxymethyldihydropteridine diphosphokinase